MLMTKAYAKINLGLNVINKDESDNYHNLDMVVVPIELHDRIEIDILPSGYETMITSDNFLVPLDETNIVYKAEKALRERFNYKEIFRIHIHKVIPIGSGLGGGSADGSSVLLALNKLLKLNLTIDELCEIGRTIGSDVPACLRLAWSRVEGKGNIISEIKKKKKFSTNVLLVFPKKALSTRDVYKNADLIGLSSPSDIASLIKSIENGDLEGIKPCLGNQLEKSAFDLCTELDQLKIDMINVGLDNVTMTGSGSCLFSLSNNEKDLKKKALILQDKGYKTIITKTL